MLEVSIITRLHGHLTLAYHGPVSNIPAEMDSARVYFITEHSGYFEINVIGGVVCVRCSDYFNELNDSLEEPEEELPFA